MGVSHGIDLLEASRTIRAGIESDRAVRRRFGLCTMGPWLNGDDGPAPFDHRMVNVVQLLLRDNPPPSAALLPDGCSRWWPRVDVVDREEGLCARLTWEARK